MLIYVKILKSLGHLENLYVDTQLSIKPVNILRLVKYCAIHSKTSILKFCKQVLLFWQQVLCAVRTDKVNTNNFVSHEILYWENMQFIHYPITN